MNTTAGATCSIKRFTRTRRERFQKSIEKILRAVCAFFWYMQRNVHRLYSSTAINSLLKRHLWLTLQHHASFRTQADADNCELLGYYSCARVGSPSLALYLWPMYCTSTYQFSNNHSCWFVTAQIFRQCNNVIGLCNSPIRTAIRSHVKPDLDTPGTEANLAVGPGEDKTSQLFNLRECYSKHLFLRLFYFVHFLPILYFLG